MNASFSSHTNRETDLESAVEDLNQSNQQLLQTIEKLKTENSKLQLFIIQAQNNPNGKGAMFSFTIPKDRYVD